MGDKIKEEKMDGAFGTYMRDVYRLVVRNLEGRRPLADLTRGWHDNIKIELLKLRRWPCT